MLLTALLVLIGDLGEASGDAGSLQGRCEVIASIEATVAPVRGHRFEAHRAAFEHGLQSIDAAIALSKTLGPAEAVSGTIAHAKLFEAEPAAWRIVYEPELSASGSAVRAAKIGPRSAVRELCMGETHELLFVTEGDNAMPVLKPDHARGPEARYADASEFIEEDAAVRIASAFRHEFEATSESSRYLDTNTSANDSGSAKAGAECERSSRARESA